MSDQCKCYFSLFQWNILADGLSNDGFLSKPETGGVTRSDGKTVEFSQLMYDIASARSIKNNEEKLKVLEDLKEKYNTEEASKRLSSIVAWERRWSTMLRMIDESKADILTFQEMDHMMDAQKDLAKLGYQCSLGGVIYRPNPNITTESYLEHIIHSGVAFAPKIQSTARKLNPSMTADNDGCAIFWKKSRFTATSLAAFQYQDQKGRLGKDGCICVRLEDITGRGTVNVLTTHLPSGEDPKKESERIACLTQLGNCMDTLEQKNLNSTLLKFVDQEVNKGPTVLAMDMNSSPKNEKSVWTTLGAVSSLTSVWAAYYDRGGEPVDRDRVVTVNKMRGPNSAQPAKIGVHALELIDHIYLGGGASLDKHVRPPTSYSSIEDAEDHLIPDTNMPSDHFPVHVNLSFSQGCCQRILPGNKT
jgi:endonuclease/exonuclease/phosphatase family metal-dependent hydrolase